MAGKRRKSRRREITFEVNDRGCHICTSHSRNLDGYPMLWKDGGNHNMHRVLYQEAHGVVLPRHILVRHDCDDRACINIEHLLEGTARQNSGDMVDRERQRFQFGEEHSHALLSNAQVLEIVEAPGSQSAIAARYGINQSTVSRIKAAKRRKDILC